MAWCGIVGHPFSPQQFEEYVKGLHWGAWRPSFIVLHNTGIPTFAQWHQVSGATRMKNLEHYYRDQLHWSAGPHLFVADDYLWPFTYLTTPGVHSPSWNAVSLGIEMVGDYSKEPFNEKVRDNTVSTLAILHLALGLDSHTLRFHKEDPLTSHRDCPGKHVDKADIIQRVHDEMVKRKSV